MFYLVAERSHGIFFVGCWLGADAEREEVAQQAKGVLDGVSAFDAHQSRVRLSCRKRLSPAADFQVLGVSLGGFCYRGLGNPGGVCFLFSSPLHIWVLMMAISCIGPSRMGESTSEYNLEARSRAIIASVFSLLL
jgi:hypothetical protein